MADSSVGVAVKNLVGSVLQHALGLMTLASWEGREAAAHYFRLLIILMGTLFLAVVGYLFLLLFLVFFLSRWMTVDWMWIALALAGAHEIAALLGIWLFVRSIGKPVFSSTISEIKKDIETLHPSSN